MLQKIQVQRRLGFIILSNIDLRNLLPKCFLQFLMVISVVRYSGRSFLPPDLAGSSRKDAGKSTDPAGKHWKLLEPTEKNPGNSRPEYCFQLPSVFRCIPAVSRRTSFTWVCGDQETFQTSGSMNDLTLDETKMIWNHVRDAHPIEFRQIYDKLCLDSTLLYFQ